MRRRVLHPPAPLPPLPPAQDTWTFELETLTPVLGGGVDPFEPDLVDIVRVPGIRGHLRWWWRALFATAEDLDAPEALLQRECKLWGGVPPSGPLRSPVRLRVEILSSPKPVPAGQHEWRESRDGRPGRHNPLPTWRSELDKRKYALFPLMVGAEDLKAQPPKPVDTRLVRLSVTFRLTVAPRPELDATQRFELAAALWFWMHFGGLGARTRRGFGALAVRRCTLAVPGWSALFDRNVALEQRLRGVFARLKQDLPGFRIGARLANAKLFLDTRASSPEDAHTQLIAKLAAFRQKPGVGRREGKEKNKPGPSHWPEPELVRALLEKTFGERPRWEHRPRPGAEGFSAPRAAFGMPLEIQFKREDREDSRANAKILPDIGDRWPSPLLLRPIAAPKGKALAALLVLSGRHPIHIPDRVRIVFKKYGPENAPTVDLAMNGAAEHLKSHGKSALQAFWRYAREHEQWTCLHLSQLFTP